MTNHLPDPRMLELLHRELDGSLEPAEHAELERRLAASPAARRYRDDLRHMDSMLRSARPPRVPADLHQRIVNSVTLPAAGRPRPWVEPLGRLVPYGIAAGLGALLMLGLIAALPSQPGVTQHALLEPVDLERMTGTLAPRAAGGPVAVDDFRVERAEVQGVAALVLRDDESFVDVIVRSERDTTIAVSFDPRRWQFGALGHADGTAEEVHVAEGIVRSRGSGSRQFMVWLRPMAPAGSTSRADDSLGIDVFVDGTLVEQGTLTVRSGPGRQ